MRELWNLDELHAISSWAFWGQMVQIPDFPHDASLANSWLLSASPTFDQALRLERPATVSASLEQTLEKVLFVRWRVFCLGGWVCFQHRNGGWHFLIPAAA